MTNIGVQQKRQRGAVLIVCLIMLTILTIIAVGTVDDIGFQSQMTRNTQIQMDTFNVAMSELNGQYDEIRQDETLLQQALVADNDYSITLTNDQLTQASTENPYTQTVSVEFLDPDTTDNASIEAQMHGDEIGSSETPTAYNFEVHSRAELTDTSIGSNQTMGVSRVKPATD